MGMKLKKPQDQMVVDDGKAGGAFISARLRNPEAELASARCKPDILGGVFAIVALLLLLTTVAVLYMNWDAIWLR